MHIQRDGNRSAGARDASLLSRRDLLRNFVMTASAFGLASSVMGVETGSTALPSATPQAGLPVFNIHDFGAAPGGKILCTSAIQRALDACGQAGGGTVRVPPGSYLTGTLTLRSNTMLYLEADATLLGSTRIEDYTPGHVIAANGANNITLAGAGTIDGQGHTFWRKSATPPESYQRRRKFGWVPSLYWKHAEKRPGNLILLQGCSGVKIRDLTLQNSESWTLHLLGCNDVQVEGVRIRNPLHGPNTDGIDLQACQDVRIAHCDIYTADDAICLKNRHKDYMRPSRNITATDCILTTTCNGFKIGTETFGDFENISFSNSVIQAALPSQPLAAEAAATIDPEHYGCALAPLAGVAVETVDGAHIRGVSVKNIVMHGVRAPVFVRLGNRGIDPAKKGAKAPPGTLEDVSISDVVADGASCASSITGLPGHPVRNVTLANVRVTHIGGGARDLAGRELPENEARYPEATMWGQMPCHGLFARHAEGVALRDARFLCAQPDARPALIGEDVSGFRVEALELDPQAAADRLIELRDVRNAVVGGTIPPRGTKTWVRVAGAHSKNIVLLPSAGGAAKQPLELGEGAPPDAVVLKSPAP